jgi:Snf7
MCARPMPSCFDEMLSTIYLGITGRYKLTYEDRAMIAEDQLQLLMVQLDRRGEVLQDTMKRTQREAISLRGDKTRCKAKFMEHRRAAAQHDRLVSYRDMVGQHMDALKSTELNKSLISTLQESSKTLKSLGVMDGVRQAEQVVQDVETSMARVLELTTVLGTPMMMGSADGDVEDELEAFLSAPAEGGEEAETPERAHTLFLLANQHKRGVNSVLAPAEVDGVTVVTPPIAVQRLADKDK